MAELRAVAGIDSGPAMNDEAPRSRHSWTAVRHEQSIDGEPMLGGGSCEIFKRAAR